MDTIIKDDYTGRIIDKRSYKLSSEKYPKIISVLGGNEEVKDSIGYTDSGRPLYMVQYRWQTICAPADLDRLEKRLEEQNAQI